MTSVPLSPQRTSIGLKTLMAITGLGMIGFVFIHMAGNLQLFLGREALNKYGVLLRTIPEVLWAVRLGLLALVLIHIWAAFQLAGRNRAARPVKYAFEATVQASRASRTMLLGGVTLLAFIVYHLAHFTWHLTNPEYKNLVEVVEGHARPDVYSMVILAFRNPIISGFYVVAQLALGMHLWHGASSWLQTLGLRTARSKSMVDRFGPAVAVIITAGNLSIPIAVLARLVNLPGGQ